MEFPSPRALADIAARPAEVAAPESGEVPSGGWSFAPGDTVATRADEPWQPQGDIEAGFAADARELKSSLRLTRALACAAHEAGRFFLATKAAAPPDLQQFVFAACGGYAAEVGFFRLSGDAPRAVNDARLYLRYRAQLRDALAHNKVMAGATDAGFWFGRDGQHAVAMVAFSIRRARLDTLTLIPDPQGDVVLEGELEGASEYILGYANQGRFGVERCAMDAAVARPRFRATCRIAADDDMAWVQILAAPPKHVLAIPVVQVLARRSPDKLLVYSEQPYGEARPVATPGELTNAIIAQLNVVRAAAKLGPVRLAADESATAGGVAAQYFASTLGAAPGDDADRVALGLIAGWQVGGMIRDGRFVSVLAPNTHDAGRWLGAALGKPVGRSTLLAREIEEVAIGPLLLSRPDGLGAVVAGYSFHHGEDHANDVRQLYNRLLLARKRQALSLPARLDGMDDVLRAELARVHRGEQQPSDALQAALDHAARRFGVNVRGYVIETTSLDAFELPAAILKRPTLTLGIGITHHKPAGAAWAQFVIVVVFVDSGAGGVEI